MPRPEHEDGVVVGRRAGGHHRLGQHAELRCEQRHERLVLDLLQAAEAQRGTRLAVPEAAPHVEASAESCASRP